MPKYWTKQNFKCDRYCGECCKKLLVQLTQKDVQRIKRLGFREEYFAMADPFDPGRKFLKKDEKGWCVFLRKDKGGKYTCSIYKSRPETCRKYPFFKGDEKLKSCLPQNLYPNVFFKMAGK